MEELQMSEDNKRKMAETRYFVEATSFEQLCLWKEGHTKCTWEQDSSGFAFLVGEDNGRPIYVTFSFYMIKGVRVAFYEATSNFVDHSVVKNFIKTNWPVKYDKGYRTAMSDAINFCAYYIDEFVPEEFKHEVK